MYTGYACLTFIFEQRELAGGRSTGPSGKGCRLTPPAKGPSFLIPHTPQYLQV